MASRFHSDRKLFKWPAGVPPARPLITLLTDFGSRDNFVASMKGVILSIHSEARIVDVSHEISPHGIEEAAHVIASCYRYFEEGTIHVVVVDPGVGSARRSLLVTTSRQYFLAPDNGLLSRVLWDERDAEVRQIDNMLYRLPSEGPTFDGRDLFSPAAAWLAMGEPTSSFGHVIDDPVVLPLAFPITQDGMLIGQIEYIDRFGNLITNITAADVRGWSETTGRPHPTVHVGTHVIEGLVVSYSQGGLNSPSVLINSSGKLEIFLDQQSATQQLRIGLGEEVRLC
jgi:S-adenosylmethionine hydrolase